jgi:hypothetical protein
MKKLLTASIGLLVLSSAAFAGGTSVTNDLRVMRESSDGSLSVNRNTHTNEVSNGTAVSVKTDKITENIALPDGVGTKSIVTDIYASSTSEGTITKNSDESLSLHEGTWSNGFSQGVGAGASYQ